MDWKDEHGVAMATSASNDWTSLTPEVAEALERAGQAARAAGEQRINVITDLLYGVVEVFVPHAKKGAFAKCVAAVRAPWIEERYNAEMPDPEGDDAEYQAAHKVWYDAAIACVRRAASVPATADALGGAALVVYSSAEDTVSAFEL